MYTTKSLSWNVLQISLVLHDILSYSSPATNVYSCTMDVRIVKTKTYIGKNNAISVDITIDEPWFAF